MAIDIIITISAAIKIKLDKYQMDFLIKKGFASFGNDLIIKTTNNHLQCLLMELGKRNITFGIKTQSNNIVSAPCFGCKK